MRFAIITLFTLLLAITVHAQKFVPGYYYDVNGEKVPGLINKNPSGKGIMKNEGFIEFKDDDKAKPQRLSASMIHGFVIGRDSFCVSDPPRYGGAWTKNDLDFLQVVVAAPTNLYMISGGTGGNGGGGGTGIRPVMSTGIGTGGVGMGGGIGINLGGGGGGSGGGMRNAYYYGESTTTMSALKQETFVEIMTDVMGDEPDVVEKIRDGTFNMGNVDGLVKYYKTMVAAHMQVPPK